MQLASAQEPGHVCSLDGECCKRPGTSGTWVWGLGSAVVRATSNPLSNCCLWLQAVQTAALPGGVGVSEAGGCRFQPHCLSCSHSACPPHEDQGKEGTRLKHCLRKVVVFLRTCNHISTARITPNVQNRSLPRLLGGGRKFALLSKLIVHREMLAYFNRRDFSIRFACQQWMNNYSFYKGTLP